MRTLLECAKGSVLGIIITNYETSASTMALLSPHAQQIWSLHFMHNYWMDIRKFSDVNPGPLPLLRAFEIDIVENPSVVDPLGPMVPPSLPLFSNAVNLKQFTLHPCKILSSHFVFPNLTMFELTITPFLPFGTTRLPGSFIHVVNGSHED